MNESSPRAEFKSQEHQVSLNYEALQNGNVEFIVPYRTLETGYNLVITAPRHPNNSPNNKMILRFKDKLADGNSLHFPQYGLAEYDNEGRLERIELSRFFSPDNSKQVPIIEWRRKNNSSSNNPEYSKLIREYDRDYEDIEESRYVSDERMNILCARQQHTSLKGKIKTLTAPKMINIDLFRSIGILQVVDYREIRSIVSEFNRTWIDVTLTYVNSQTSLAQLEERLISPQQISPSSSNSAIDERIKEAKSARSRVILENNWIFDIVDLKKQAENSYQPTTIH